MKIVGNDRNSDCLSINILSLLQKVYILKTTTTKQRSKQNKNEKETKKRKTEGKKKGY